MPIYEYRCRDCGHELDALQKVADAPLEECPACGSPSLKRLISAPRFRLKGDGWYETDFKSDKERRRNLADRPEDTADKSGKDGKDGRDGKGKEDKPAAQAGTASEGSGKGDAGKGKDKGDAGKGKKSDSGEGKASTKSAGKQGSGTEAA